MPSVYATWTGQCRHHAARKEVCHTLTGLAELSHRFFETSLPIKSFDQAIEGTILVSPKLFHHPPSTPKLTPIRATTLDTLRAEKCRRPEELFSLPNVTLYGIEFHLYDPRHLYDGEDRVSFVFCAGGHTFPEGHYLVGTGDLCLF